MHRRMHLFREPAATRQDDAAARILVMEVASDVGPRPTDSSSDVARLIILRTCREDPTEVTAVSVACLFNTTGNRDMESTQGCLESVHTAALHAIAA
ncbi:hypothetical protein PC128_g13881 [Phytophthora cactorum]|nr:hypothetical protein PC128_g13881 [Phytophthora cactorum]KAG4054159.1 hypothetical protein PC123_g10708 [Phytophthora cactorum]